MNETKLVVDRAGLQLPAQRDLYYGGAWHAPKLGRYRDFTNPATGDVLGQAADASVDDAAAAIRAAQDGFARWRRVAPLERAKILRRIAGVIRDHAYELAMLDSAGGGNPISEMQSDAAVAAAMLEFFAGLVTEIKGASIPMGPDAVNFSVREPLGVIARIVAFNHPFMFCASKIAAPLAAGNVVIIKPPEQVPLSALRLAELIGPLLPPGVFSLLTGGHEIGQALSSHVGVAMVTLIGSVPTARSIMKSASETLKPMLLELGGKNALIAYPDADPDEVAGNAVRGMNFTWCGQSCGSMSRVFLHDDIHDAVVDRMKEHVARYRPGIPTDPETNMGAIVNRVQYDRVMNFIQSASAEGAELVHGGKHPDTAGLEGGCFIEPTIFKNVTVEMRIAREEIFGPVMSVFRWNDEAQMLADVNAVEYGLTCSIWTNDLETAHRTAAEVQAGYVWINEVSTHFLGAPFGGYKQSGIGREDCFAELVSMTQEKNIHIRMKPRSR